MNLKKIVLALSTLGLVLTLSSCASTSKNRNVPKWLNDLPPTDELWGIGSANLGDDADPSQAIAVAESRAYVSLSRQIGVSVEKAVLDIYQSASGSGSSADNFSSVDDVSRLLSQVTLQGAEPNKRDRMGDGTWWVRVRIPKASVNREVAANFDTEEAARLLDFKVRKEEAMRLLDSELGKTKPSGFVQDADEVGSQGGVSGGGNASSGNTSAAPEPEPTKRFEINSITDYLDAFDWITANAVGSGYYLLTFKTDIDALPRVLDKSAVNNKNGVTIAFSGDANERVVRLTGTGSLFTVGGYIERVVQSGTTLGSNRVSEGNQQADVRLLLGNNITLKGTASNNGPLIVVWYSGRLTMKAGSMIMGNTNTFRQTPRPGGGVRVGNTGVFIMEGGKISENTAADSYYNNSQYKSGGGVTVDGGTFLMNGGEISGNADSTGGVYVTNGIFTMKSGKISGNTVSGVYVDTNGIFTLEGGEISGHTGQYATDVGVSVNGQGTFTMNGGVIQNNSGSGVGLAGTYQNPTFTLNNGKISGNLGGGVLLGGGDSNSGTFTMNGGEISGNTSSPYSSGGVTNSGTFTMYGGKISGNTSSSSNGGGGVSNSGTFTMYGGEISNNTALSGKGGGVWVANGRSFTMYGGEIWGNTAQTGGGVFVDSQNYERYSSGTFKKQPAPGSTTSGVIYGLNGGSKANTVTGDGTPNSNRGRAVFARSLCENTVGENHHLDSTKTKAEGGGWDQ